MAASPGSGSQALCPQLSLQQLPWTPAWALSPGGSHPTLFQMLVQRDGAKQSPKGRGSPISPTREKVFRPCPPQPWRRRRATGGWMGFPARVLPTGTEQFCPQPLLWLGPAYMVLSPLMGSTSRVGAALRSHNLTWPLRHTCHFSPLPHTPGPLHRLSWEASTRSQPCALGQVTPSWASDPCWLFEELPQ